MSRQPLPAARITTCHTHHARLLGNLFALGDFPQPFRRVLLHARVLAERTARELKLAPRLAAGLVGLGKVPLLLELGGARAEEEQQQQVLGAVNGQQLALDARLLGLEGAELVLARIVDDVGQQRVEELPESDLDAAWVRHMRGHAHPHALGCHLGAGAGADLLVYDALHLAQRQT